MKETDWTIGRGLKENGYPDSTWAGSIITIHPYMDGFTVNIKWGTTWGHLASKFDSDLRTALRLAMDSAIKGGCPPEWLTNKEE